MNLFQLEYFVAVAEELHFARAAERLHVAQPSLSFQIKQLEEELGVRLFERTTRRVDLTDAGRAFLDKTNAALHTLQDGVDTARRIERGEEGTLVLGYNGYALYNVLPPLLHAFRVRHPHARLKVREVYEPHLEPQLLSGELDAAVAIMESPHSSIMPASHPDMEWLGLVEEPMYIAVPRTNPISRKTDVRLQSLAREDFIVMDRVQKPNAYAQTVFFCQSAGFFPNIVQEALSIEAGIGLVASEAGITFATESMRELRADKVAYVPLVDPQVNVGFGMVWPRDKDSLLLKSLLEIARDLNPLHLQSWVAT
jgi:DNA-binding transcriptional LysR family regulator